MDEGADRRDTVTSLESSEQQDATQQQQLNDNRNIFVGSENTTTSEHCNVANDNTSCSIDIAEEADEASSSLESDSPVVDTSPTNTISSTAGETSHSHIIEVEECRVKEECQQQQQQQQQQTNTECLQEHQTYTKTNCCVCNCHSHATTDQSESVEGAVDQSALPAVNIDNVPTDIEVGLDNAAFEFLRKNSTNSNSSSISVKPPTYRSLGEFYLHDEPPRYEFITGKKLANELVSLNFVGLPCRHTMFKP